MIKIYKGYCEEQEREYQVLKELIDTGENNFIEGRLECEYDRHNGCKYYDKNGKCSILKRKT